MDNLLDKFKCLQCNATGCLEVIVFDCFVCDKIESIYPDGTIDYDFGSTEITGGQIDRFICSRCGHAIESITTEKELIDYLNDL